MASCLCMLLNTVYSLMVCHGQISCDLSTLEFTVQYSFVLLIVFLDYCVATYMRKNLMYFLTLHRAASVMLASTYYTINVL